MNKNIFKKIASLSVISLFSLQIMYVFVEPTVVTAATDDDVVVVTLNVDAGISITDGADEIMEPTMGMTANKAIGSSSWNVKTNSATGYTLAVKASTTPALQNGVIDSFADYTAVGGVPDTWGGVASGTKEFGFSGYGDDVLDATWGTHTGCGSTSTGIPATGSKYFGFSTSDKTLATRATITTTAGVTTNICFAAEQNGVYAASGAYTATITATATTI